MNTALTQPCETCDGAGLVPRPRRRLPNGEPDQLDTVEWPSMVCETCNGTGRVPLDHTSVVETAGA
ncbi:MAG TPA: hypothetical protein VHW66_12000 [Stellaceae bacterium]|jgi:DnaJ-class molecular chaperone|nr:hypothetical protein [Stellaceae bacterium]